MYHKGPILRDILCVVCWQLLLVKQGVDTEIFAVSDLASVAELKEVSALSRTYAAYCTASQHPQR